MIHIGRDCNGVPQTTISFRLVHEDAEFNSCILVERIELLGRIMIMIVIMQRASLAERLHNAQNAYKTLSKLPPEFNMLPPSYHSHSHHLLF